MPYKPKHCCQCGEKIERIDWKPWTSRRFCELCETEFGIYDWLTRGLVGIGLLFGLFGIGSYLQKPEKQLSVAPNQLIGGVSNTSGETVNQKIVSQALTNNSVQTSAQANNSARQTKPLEVSDLKTKPVAAPISEPPEKVYFCGALTKKGTMCSRRMKSGGRCWQHAGQAAMLPQEKLIAGQ